ncbi:MAG: MMPL family transporter, partial [Nocardioides sp.]
TLTPPQTNKKGDVVLLSAVPTTAPATQQTADLLKDVRDDVVPEATSEGGITTYVGGYTASYADLATLISQRLLLVIGTVILLGFVLLMIAFRSILVPLQAAVTNVLSAAAAFGILTACFQFGWGIDLVGLDTSSDTVPIASYVPLMMFAVLFGLSMDYEVFLVSHIQQHHLAGEPARQAAASGLRTSARITTAACLIMTSVFASFILNGDPTIKQFGVGLATAVLLAGVLVITLAPATIAMMGEAAWWLPAWLDKLLPHVDIEGGGQEKGGEGDQPAPVAPAPPGPVFPAPVAH